MEKIIKNTLKYIGIFIVSWGLSALLVYAISGGDTILSQRDPTNSFNAVRALPMPAGNSVIAFDTTISQPMYAALGSGLSMDSAAGAINVSSVPQSSVAGLVSALASKFNAPAGTTSQYVRGDGTLAAFPSTSSRVFSTPTFSGSTTASQLSATRDAVVFYGYDATVSISLLAGQSVTAVLEYADNSAMTTNLVTLDSNGTGNSGVLGLTQVNTIRVGGTVPAGKYRRVRFSLTGTGTAAPNALKAGQEVLEP